LPEPDKDERYIDLYTLFDSYIIRPIYYTIENSVFWDIDWMKGTEGVIHIHFYNPWNYVLLKNTLFENYTSTWELLTFEVTNTFEIQNVTFKDIPKTPKLYLLIRFAKNLNINLLNFVNVEPSSNYAVNSLVFLNLVKEILFSNLVYTDSTF